MSVLTSADRFKRALAANDLRAIKRLTDTYAMMYQRLQARLQDIMEGSPTRARIIALSKQIEEELARYSNYALPEITRIGRDGVTYGIRDMNALLTESLPAGIRVNFNKLPVDAIIQALGFLSPDGELYKRIEGLSGYYAPRIKDELIAGIGTGANPETTAKLIYRKFEGMMGMTLTDVIRQTRTVQLYSYREASRASMIANQDVVEGWVWYAEIGDPDTCLSCIAMHGTVHGLDETLDDHHNGRCAMLPMLIGEDNPVEVNGADWLTGQPEATQREIMGAGKYEAWQEGKFGIEQLSVQRDDPVYGTMRGEASLKDLIGQ